MSVAIENLTIVFGILARDCKDSLQSNMARVEEIGQVFKDYHVVVYENDSKDGTTEMLKEWTVQNNHVVAICETTNQTTIPHKSEELPYPDKSVYRIEKMVRFRNRVLDEVRSRFEPDLFCFIDIDVESFSSKDVIDAIRQVPDDWGALFASGHSIFRKPDGTEKVSRYQYDSYAFVPDDVDPMKTGEWVIDFIFHEVTAWYLNSLLRSCDYLSCRSAFNGIGIYRWEAIRDLKFCIMQTPELKEVSACFCEHVPFNGEIKKKGYKLYATRKIEVTYNHKNITFKGWYKQWKYSLKVRWFLVFGKHPFKKRAIGVCPQLYFFLFRIKRR